jgi:hypothetical protein
MSDTNAYVGLVVTAPSASNMSAVQRQIQSQLSNIGLNVQFKNAKQLQQQIDKSTKGIHDFGEAVGLAGRRFVAYTSAVAIVGRLGLALSRATSDAIRFEKEFVKIAQVLDTNVSSIKGLETSITSLSRSYALSANIITKTGVVLAQSGLNAQGVKKALEALTKTTLASTFGDIANTAEGAVAIIAQFREGAGSLERQLGAVNAVSKKFAVESQDIIDAVKRAGGAFQAAGGNFEEFIALFTSVRSTTRESAETIATGFRTIFARIQRPKTIEYFRELNIELADVAGNLVDPYTAIRRLSQGLDQLGIKAGSIKFAQVIEELGGIRQVSRVIPLLQRFTTAEEARQVAIAGGASLDADAAKAKETLAFKIEEVRQNFSALIREISQDSSLRLMIDTALKIANSFVEVARSIKAIIPLLALIGVFKFSKLAGAALKRGFAPTEKALYANSGGFVPGFGDTDTVPAMLTPGEFVINKKSAKAIGYGELGRLNKYAKGGVVSKVQKFSTGGKVDDNDDDDDRPLTSVKEAKSIIKENLKYYEELQPEQIKLILSNITEKGGSGRLPVEIDKTTQIDLINAVDDLIEELKRNSDSKTKTADTVNPANIESEQDKHKRLAAESRRQGKDKDPLHQAAQEAKEKARLERQPSKPTVIEPSLVEQAPQEVKTKAKSIQAQAAPALPAIPKYPFSDDEIPGLAEDPRFANEIKYDNAKKAKAKFDQQLEDAKASGESPELIALLTRLGEEWTQVALNIERVINKNRKSQPAVTEQSQVNQVFQEAKTTAEIVQAPAAKNRKKTATKATSNEPVDPRYANEIQYENNKRAKARVSQDIEQAEKSGDTGQVKHLQQQKAQYDKDYLKYQKIHDKNRKEAGFVKSFRSGPQEKLQPKSQLELLKRLGEEETPLAKKVEEAANVHKKIENRRSRIDKGSNDYFSEDDIKDLQAGLPVLEKELAVLQQEVNDLISGNPAATTTPKKKAAKKKAASTPTPKSEPATPEIVTTVVTGQEQSATQKKAPVKKKAAKADEEAAKKEEKRLKKNAQARARRAQAKAKAAEAAAVESTQPQPQPSQPQLQPQPKQSLYPSSSRSETLSDSRFHKSKLLRDYEATKQRVRNPVKYSPPPTIRRRSDGVFTQGQHVDPLVPTREGKAVIDLSKPKRFNAQDLKKESAGSLSDVFTGELLSTKKANSELEKLKNSSKSINESLVGVSSVSTQTPQAGATPVSIRASNAIAQGHGGVAIRKGIDGAIGVNTQDLSAIEELFAKSISNPIENLIVKAQSLVTGKSTASIETQKGYQSIKSGYSTEGVLQHEAGHLVDYTTEANGNGVFASKQKGTFNNLLSQAILPSRSKELDSLGFSGDDKKYREKSEEVFADTFALVGPNTKAFLAQMTSLTTDTKAVSDAFQDAAAGIKSGVLDFGPANKDILETAKAHRQAQQQREYDKQPKLLGYTPPEPKRIGYKPSPEDIKAKEKQETERNKAAFGVKPLNDEKKAKSEDPCICITRAIAKLKYSKSKCGCRGKSEKQESPQQEQEQTLAKNSGNARSSLGILLAGQTMIALASASQGLAESFIKEGEEVGEFGKAINNAASSVLSFSGVLTSAYGVFNSLPSGIQESISKIFTKSATVGNIKKAKGIKTFVDGIGSGPQPKFSTGRLLKQSKNVVGSGLKLDFKPLKSAFTQSLQQSSILKYLKSKGSLSTKSLSSALKLGKFASGGIIASLAPAIVKGVSAGLGFKNKDYSKDKKSAIEAGNTEKAKEAVIGESAQGLFSTITVVGAGLTLLSGPIGLAVTGFGVLGSILYDNNSSFKSFVDSIVGAADGLFNLRRDAVAAAESQARINKASLQYGRSLTEFDKKRDKGDTLGALKELDTSALIFNEGLKSEKESDNETSFLTELTGIGETLAEKESRRGEAVAKYEEQRAQLIQKSLPELQNLTSDIIDTGGGFNEFYDTLDRELPGIRRALSETGELESVFEQLRKKVELLEFEKIQKAISLLTSALSDKFSRESDIRSITGKKTSIEDTLKFTKESSDVELFNINKSAGASNSLDSNLATSKGLGEFLASIRATDAAIKSVKDKANTTGIVFADLNANGQNQSYTLDELTNIQKLQGQALLNSKALINQHTAAIKSELQARNEAIRSLNNYADNFIFASNEQRRSMKDTFEAARRLSQSGGDINSISESQRGPVSQLLNEFKDIPLFNGKTGSQVLGDSRISFLGGEQAIKGRLKEQGLGDDEINGVIDQIRNGSVSETDKLVQELKQLNELQFQADLVNATIFNDAVNVFKDSVILNAEIVRQEASTKQQKVEEEKAKGKDDKNAKAATLISEIKSIDKEIEYAEKQVAANKDYMAASSISGIRTSYMDSIDVAKERAALKGTDFLGNARQHVNKGNYLKAAANYVLSPTQLVGGISKGSDYTEEQLDSVAEYQKRKIYNKAHGGRFGGRIEQLRQNKQEAEEKLSNVQRETAGIQPFPVNEDLIGLDHKINSLKMSSTRPDLSQPVPHPRMELSQAPSMHISQRQPETRESISPQMDFSELLSATQSLSNAASTLPTEINMNIGTPTVKVVIDGAQLLSNLTPSIKSLVMSSIVKELTEFEKMQNAGSSYGAVNAGQVITPT